jgi:peptide-methionine (S)-S-oxide reductase
MLRTLAALLVSILALGGASAQQAPAPAPGGAGGGLELATFAAGCFWCVEEAFDKLDGVFTTVSGFMGGKTQNPTYNQVVRGGTGHTEAVQVTYDPRKVSYEQLLHHFWRNVDPLDKDGQFCDRGDGYRPEIFVHNEAQKAAAEASLKALVASKRFQQAVVVPVTPAGPFWRAEDYHQDFYRKNPGHYKRYVVGCGRYDRLESLWGREARGGKS